MASAGRAALWGASLGALAGVLRLALEAPGIGELGGPQTSAGLVALYAGYATPWALAGSGIGYLIGRRKGGATSALKEPQIDPAPTTALQRLGHVLGWTGNIIAVPLVLIGAYGFTQPGGDPFIKGASLALGVVAFLLGRALRYIFAGSFR